MGKNYYDFQFMPSSVNCEDYEQQFYKQFKQDSVCDQHVPSNFSFEFYASKVNSRISYKQYTD